MTISKKIGLFFFHMNIELTTKSSFVTFFGFEEHFWLECPLSLQILQDGRPFNLSWTTMGSDPIQSLAKQSIKLTFWLNLRESLLLNSRSLLMLDSSPSSERDFRPLPPLIFISSAECSGGRHSKYWPIWLKIEI